MSESALVSGWRGSALALDYRHRTSGNLNEPIRVRQLKLARRRVVFASKPESTVIDRIDSERA